MRIMTNPLSIDNIKNIAREVREYFHIFSSSYFPILDVLELLDIKGYLNLVVLPNDDPSFSDDVVAYYDSSNNSIYISDDLYNNTEYDYRSNFTLAHEFFHFIQYNHLNFTFEEVFDTPPFKDPEWQANEFAGQLLIPDEALDLPIEDIIETYKVSETCALTRLVKKKVRKKREKQKIDLHIHTTYSDGTFTPSEIINKAKDKELAYIAITDHNEFRGSKEAYKIAPKMVIPGVEIDSIIDDINVHILAYNFDYNDLDFSNFIDKNREMLFKVDDGFIDVLISNGYNITIDEYNKYVHNPRNGGWKALNFAIEKKIVNNIKDYFMLMNKYNYSHAIVPFPSVKEVIDRIHKANAIAVLAHPYKTFPKDKLIHYLNTILDYGIDGIEAYYYNTSDDDINIVKKFALDHDLVTTVGNDYHGTFTDSELGYRNEKYLNLKLDGIINKN